MASITVGTAGLDALLAGVRKQVERKWASTKAVAIDTATFGEGKAKKFTATRPGRTTGKAGRIESGDMIDAIKAEPVSFSSDLVQARYGFTAEFEDYFAMQTVTGFDHVRADRFIEPTFALRDSITPTQNYARQALKAAL